VVDIDPEDVKKFHRMTHSEYDYSTPVWTYGVYDERPPTCAVDHSGENGLIHANAIMNLRAARART
jgi:hypothetical protein